MTFVERTIGVYAENEFHEACATPLSATWRYDTADPMAVKLTFHAPDEDSARWEFALDLLAYGGGADESQVRVSRGDLIVEVGLHGFDPQHPREPMQAAFGFLRTDIDGFLADVEDASRLGASVSEDLDEWLRQLLT